MKILHVIPYADPIYGGPCVAVRNMAEAMVRLGAEVHVVVTNAAGKEDLSFADAEVREENGVVFHYFRRTFPRSWFRAPGMVRWLRIYAGEFDLLHLHVPFTAPFLWAAQAARAANRPYIVTPHGLLDPWSMKQKAWKKIPYLRWLERKTLSGAAALHVTATMEANCVEALKLGPKVHCLPLAVSSRTAVLPHRKESGRAHILCIARLHPVKAIDVLLRAFARLREQGLAVVLDLAGDGDDAYVAWLRQQAIALGVYDAVILHGHVDAKEKHDLFGEAGCFALLSYHENFGLAAAEALAAGVPVVVSDQVGLAPDVQAYQAGHVVPVGDVEEAAKALKSLLYSEETNGYRVRARQLALERYGDAHFVSGLATLYHSVLGDNTLSGL